MIGVINRSKGSWIMKARHCPGAGIIMFTGIVILASIAGAEIPRVISYQGRISDGEGNPVTDGTYNMRFRLFDAETGGNLEWDSGVQSIALDGGIFNVLLGDAGQSAVDLPFDEDYWLVVTFDGVNQLLRQRLSSVGYAYMASGLVPGTEIWGSADTGNRATVAATNIAIDGTGVCGVSMPDEGMTSKGVLGITGSEVGGFGVFGVTYNGTGYGVYSSGNFAASGTKSCVVKTSRGPTLMYCQESPENWFEDFGEGRLVSGRCRIELDPLFLETVTIDDENPMHVFIQQKGKCSGTYVRPGFTGFDVIEQDEGTSDISFSYRVVAKRKGFEEKRLDYCKAAESDPYLYEEIRIKSLRKIRKKSRMQFSSAGN